MWIAQHVWLEVSSLYNTNNMYTLYMDVCLYVYVCRRYIQSTRLVLCKMDGCSEPLHRICTRDKVA